PAYRVSLSDGTRLLASGHHRFLSNRGWKAVTGTEQGAARRPHLTLNNSLLGTGRFACGPADADWYRRGYLCGLIRGDGTLPVYDPSGRRRGRAGLHQFRRAATDLEGLAGAADFLAERDVPTLEFDFQVAQGCRPMRAIRTSS